MKTNPKMPFILILVVLAGQASFITCMEGGTIPAENSSLPSQLVAQGQLTIEELEPMFASWDSKQVSDYIQNYIITRAMQLLDKDISEQSEAQRKELVNLFALLADVKKFLTNKDDQQRIRDLKRDLRFKLLGSITWLQEKAALESKDRVKALKTISTFGTNLVKSKIKIPYLNPQPNRNSWELEQLIEDSENTLLILESHQTLDRALRILTKTEPSHEETLKVLKAIDAVVYRKSTPWAVPYNKLINARELLFEKLHKLLRYEPGLVPFSRISEESPDILFWSGAGMLAIITLTVLYHYLFI